jgi:hypothetical protein
LRNVRQRLQLMHDVQAEFAAGLVPSDMANASACYEVRVRVPWSKGGSA